MDMKKDVLHDVQKKRKSKKKSKKLLATQKKIKNYDLKRSAVQLELTMKDENGIIDDEPGSDIMHHPQVKKGKKRKKSEARQDNESPITDIRAKKTKKSSDDSMVTEDNTDKSSISGDEEPSFSVDMSKLSRGRGRISPVNISDLQQLILYGLLSQPTFYSRLPVWANLEPTSVKGIVIVSLKYVTPGMFNKNEKCFPQLGAMFDVVLPFENSGYLTYIKSPPQSLLTIAMQPKKETKESTKAVHRKNYILTEIELLKNEYLLPGLSQEAQDFVTIPRSSETEATNSSSMFALDCEMCMSAKGRELTRISLVDELHEVVYDTLVKPDQPITDYLTRFSGITEESLRDVKTTLKDVQEKLKEIIPPDAIIVGHSMEFDFNSLKFFHNKVIDTSVIFDDGRCVYFKPGLKYLARKYLKTEIQGDFSGHCSIEDARTCMKLVQLKIEKGPKFGKKDFKTEKCLLDHISDKSTKNGVIIDRASIARQFSGNSDALPCTDDEEIVSKVIKVLQKYQFIWCQLHNLDTVHPEKRTSNNKMIKPLLQEMDERISNIHDNLEDGMLFIVLCGAADTSRIKSLKENGSEKKKLKKAEESAKRGLCFIKLVNGSQRKS